MKLYWTDNICTVGETNVCGPMSLDDMELLSGAIPSGRFTPCFSMAYTPGLGHEWEYPTQLDYWRAAWSFIPHYMGHRVFYFSFKEEFLPAVMLLNDRQMTRGERSL